MANNRVNKPGGSTLRVRTLRASPFQSRRVPCVPGRGPCLRALALFTLKVLQVRLHLLAIGFGPFCTSSYSLPSFNPHRRRVRYNASSSKSIRPPARAYGLLAVTSSSDGDRTTSPDRLLRASVSQSLRRRVRTARQPLPTPLPVNSPVGKILKPYLYVGAGQTTSCKDFHPRV
jgi:hypothetical protein